MFEAHHTTTEAHDMRQIVDFYPACERSNNTDVNSVTLWHEHKNGLSTQVESFTDDGSEIWFFQGTMTHAHIYMSKADLTELRDQITDALEGK